MGSLRHDMMRRVTTRGRDGKAPNERTIKNAKAQVDKFVAWQAENRGAWPRGDILRNADKARECMQAYSEHLQAAGYSPATVHTYLAGPCKGLGVPMAQVNKPTRTGETITRSRGERNGRGARDAASAENARLASFQRAVGIRRAELAKLRGRDLVTDSKGQMCVHVARGKGGKEQYQVILPQYQDLVRSVMTERGPDELVFTREEMANDMDLHGMRREVAQEAYGYYADRIAHEPGYAQQLRADLMDRWTEAHGTDRHVPVQFARAMEPNCSPIRLRPSEGNYQAAIQHGRPTEFDRLAVLAVSVYHLSHWRTDVTVSNYEI